MAGLQKLFKKRRPRKQQRLHNPLWYGRIEIVCEHSSHVLCSLQNLEMETLPSTSADDLEGKSSSSLYENNCSGESNQQDNKNAQIDTANLENEQHPPCDSINSGQGGDDYVALEDVLDKNPQSFDALNVKREKRRKIGITRESIEECLSENMTLQHAAKYLNVHESTIKRRLKEFNITWSGNKRKKQHGDAMNKEDNTESQCERNSPPLRMMDPSNSAHHDHVPVRIAGSGSGRGSTFDLKATYDEETVRIDNFSLRSDIEQLEEVVGRKLELDVDKIKMKYLDATNEWIRLTAVSDLVHALHYEEPSGKRVVRLLINLKT